MRWPQRVTWELVSHLCLSFAGDPVAVIECTWVKATPAVIQPLSAVLAAAALLLSAGTLQLYYVALLYLFCFVLHFTLMHVLYH